MIISNEITPLWSISNFTGVESLDEIKEHLTSQIEPLLALWNVVGDPFNTYPLRLVVPDELTSIFTKNCLLRLRRPSFPSGACLGILFIVDGVYVTLEPFILSDDLDAAIDTIDGHSDAMRACRSLNDYISIMDAILL